MRPLAIFDYVFCTNDIFKLKKHLEGQLKPFRPHFGHRWSSWSLRFYFFFFSVGNSANPECYATTDFLYYALERNLFFFCWYDSNDCPYFLAAEIKMMYHYTEQTLPNITASPFRSRQELREHNLNKRPCVSL